MLIRREASSDGLISLQKKTQNMTFQNWFMNLRSGGVVHRDFMVHEPILESMDLCNKYLSCNFGTLFVSQ